MTFAGINYVAVIVATIAAMAVGFAWYNPALFGKAWMKAAGKSPEDMRRSPTPIATAAVAQLIMAWMLAGLIGHMGEVTIRTGVISAGFVWLGFVLTTMGVNHAFQGVPRMLTLIDGFYWLAVLLVMGLVIGAFGA